MDGAAGQHPTGIVPERVAEILVGPDGERRSSGYRTTTTTVVTVAHGLVDGAEVRVRFNARRADEWSTAATVAFVDTASAVDLAILTIQGRHPDERLAPVLFGRVPDADAALPVSAVGYPRFKLRESQEVFRDSHHVVGTAPLLSNRKEGTLQIDAPPPAQGPSHGHSPWEGMSGAAVFSGGRMIGLVQRHHRSDGPGGLAAARIDRWYDLLSPQNLRKVCELLPLPASVEQVPYVHPAGDAAPQTATGRRPGVCVPPGLPARMVDRPRERDAAVAATCGDRGGVGIVALVGMPGAGKSVLARSVVADRRVVEHFGDRIAWLALGPEPNLVGHQGRLAEAFGDTRPIADADSGRERLRELLHDAPCLVVLDDIWTTEAIDAFDLDSPDVVLLVTTRSRDALYEDTVVFGVDAVDSGKAREVLARYSGAAVAELPPEAGEVAEECGRLMLALAIAGGMVAEGRRWASVLERLRRADLERLSAKLHGYTYPNLLRAVEASVTDLPDRDRDCLLDLVVFENSVLTPDVAALHLWELSGLDEFDAEDLLVRLSRRSLIIWDRERSRFALHDIIYDYVRFDRDDEQVRNLHATLAASLLDRWGGLAGGLPALQDLEPGDIDRYGVSHLVRHLAAAHDPQTVHRLLSLETQQAAGRVDNTWYAVHERLGLIAGYLSDVRLAIDAARRAVDTALAARAPAPIELEFRYAAVVGSVSSIASNLPVELVIGLVEAKMWSPQQALANVGAVPHDEVRADALVRLAPLLADGAVSEALRYGRAFADAGLRARVLSAVACRLDEADLAAQWAGIRGAVDEITDLLDRADTCIELLSMLPDAYRPELVRRGVAAARAATPSDLAAGRLVALARVTGDESPSLVAEAWSMVCRTDEPYWQARALAEVAPALPPHLLHDAVRVARDNPEVAGRAHAVSSLVPHLPDPARVEVAGEALAAVAAIRNDPYLQATLLATVAAHLPSDGIDGALAVARRISDPGAAAHAYVAVLPRLTGDRATAVAGLALAAARATTRDPLSRAEALTATVVYLSGADRMEALREAIATIAAIADPACQVRAVGAIAPLLPPELVEPALRVIESIADPYCSAQALTMIASVTAGGTAHLLAALSVIRSVHCDAWAPAAALAALAAWLPDKERLDIVGDALSRIRAIGNATMQVHALMMTAAHVPPQKWLETLAIAATIRNPGKRDSTLSQLAQHFAERPADELVAAFAVFAEPPPPDARRAQPPPDVVSTLLAFVPPEHADRIDERALAALLAPDRPGQLADDVPASPSDLDADPDQVLFDHAADYAQWLSDELRRCDDEAARTLVDDAVTVLSQLTEPADLLSVVEVLGTRATAGQAARIIAYATPLLGLDWFILLAGAVGGKLPDAERARLIDELDTDIGTVTDPDEGLRLRVLLAQSFGDERLVGAALAGAESVSHPGKRREALEGIADRLTPALRDRAIRLAVAIPADDERAQALSALIRYLPEDRLPEALRLAQTIPALDVRTDVLRTIAVVAGSQHDARWDGYWRAALDVAASAGRQLVMETATDASAVLFRRGGVDAVRRTCAALLEVERWWPAGMDSYDWLPDPVSDVPAHRPGPAPDDTGPPREDRMFVPGLIVSEPTTLWDERARDSTDRLIERLLSRYVSRRDIPTTTRVEVLPARVLVSTDGAGPSHDSASANWYDGRYVEAIDEITSYLRNFPNDAQMLSYRGQILGDLGFATLALTDLNKALSLQIDQMVFAYARSAAGYALGTLGRYDEAAQEFEESLKLAPGNAWTYFRRGLVRYAAGDLVGAERDFGLAELADDPPLNDLQSGKLEWALRHAFPAHPSTAGGMDG